MLPIRRPILRVCRTGDGPVLLFRGQARHPASPLASQTLDYFDTLWSNRASLGIEYTADFAAYADPGQGHYWLYRFLEGIGMSDF